MNFLINIVGPTAIGKTSLSIDLAKYYNTEIVSADSRQFFKEMSIGTAKPTMKERQLAKHHLVDFISIKDNYNAGLFESEALNVINKIHKNVNVAVMVGGSGLYVKAVTKGIDDVPSDIKIRNKLNIDLKERGLKFLQERLKKLDPNHYNRMDIYNPQRIIRALEVCLATGKPYSSFRQGKKKKRNFETISIGLIADREIIYNRINQRVDLMIEAGLVDEVEKLLPYKELNALNTVGYKEIFQYLEGELTLEKSIEEIKKHTRQFAKRQLTWFKKDLNVKWFDISNKSEIIPYINTIINPEKS